MKRVCSLAFALIVLCSASASFAANPAGSPESPELYGCPWSADSLGNLQVGKEIGRKISLRFRASQDGEVDNLRVFFIFRALGYYHGDGGQALIEMQGDDGSELHAPDGKTLGSVLVKDPMKDQFRLVTFDKTVTLQKGKLYHIVFSNPGFDPIENYTSVDDLYNGIRKPNMQPGSSNLDLAVVWKHNGDSPWEVNYAHTPIFDLTYKDGGVQGQGYVDCRSESGLFEVSGPHMACELFRPTGRDRNVTSVTVRLRKRGAPGDLTISLQKNDGTLVESAIVKAADVPTENAWVKAALPTHPMVKKGEIYMLVLSAPAGDPYLVYPLQDGTKYQPAPNMFGDGYYETNDGTGWAPFWKRTDHDLQFYFEVEKPKADTVIMKE